MTSEEIYIERYRLESTHAWFWATQRYFPVASSFLEIGKGTIPNLTVYAEYVVGAVKRYYGV